MSFITRQAQPSDAPTAAKLIYKAYKSYANYVCASKDPEVILHRLEFFFAHPKVNLVHFTHTSLLVQESTQQIAGLVASFRGDFIPNYYLNLAELLAHIGTLEDPVVQHSMVEFTESKTADDNEFHLDAIAIEEEFRGRNLTDLLFEVVKKRAKDNGKKRITLLSLDEMVDFYKNKGFTFQKKLEDQDHYNVMELPL